MSSHSFLIGLSQKKAAPLNSIPKKRWEKSSKCSNNRLHKSHASTVLIRQSSQRDKFDQHLGVKFNPLIPERRWPFTITTLPFTWYLFLQIGSGICRQKMCYTVEIAVVAAVALCSSNLQTWGFHKHFIHNTFWKKI